MHAVTLRRLIVFGVCAVGVGCLYLVPSLARPSHPGPGPRALDEPTAQPSGRTARDTSSPVTAQADASPSRPSADLRTGTAEEADEANRRGPAAAHPLSSGATAFDPAEGSDEESPAAVADLTSAAVTPTGLSLRWPAASDNVGVVGYTVVLDGFEVATTPETSTTIRWFNNDAREHVVQVRALDAAGNLSVSSPSLLVARPTPTPSPEPGPSTPAPEPTQRPAPSPSPSAPTGSADEPADKSPSSDPAGPAEPDGTAPAEAR